MAEFRSGFVAVVGSPNVGKSTLVNALLGQKIAAVSPRPQTTRRRQLGILTTDSAQLVFVDTPGLHRPRHKLGQFLNREARESLDGIDVVVWLVDLSHGPAEDDVDVAALLNTLNAPISVIIAGNKIDLVEAQSAGERLAEYSRLLTQVHLSSLISATRGDGLDDLQGLLVSACPAGAAAYEAEQITDLYERDIAADLIREAALIELRDEVPHAIAVRIDEYLERPNGSVYIAATLFVERDSQKGIVIGEGGKMLRRLGTRARREIEAMAGHKVFLELHVKVEKDWRNDDTALKRLGYDLRD